MFCRCSHRQVFFSLAAAVAVASICANAFAIRVEYPLGDGDESGSSRPEAPLLMRTAVQTVVHAEPKSWSPMIARIEAGAVLSVTDGHGKSGCKGGWLRRASGGYVCAQRLVEAAEARPSPSPEDAPNLLDGLGQVLFGPGGANLYHTIADLDLGHALVLLFRGSVVTVRERIRRNGEEFIVTRQGMYARAIHAIDLPKPVTSLGIAVAEGATAPGGIVIAEGAVLRKAPRNDAEAIGPLARWSAIPRPNGGFLTAADGFIALPNGGFASDDDVARIREVKAPQGLEENEKWIAIDLGEQLLHAYVGTRLVRVVPCSTGIKNNTFEGHYRIQWKRRIQTMQLKHGHTRVEDVQWVMYYDKARSLAIHTATWHGDFGRRRSHGCVNLPRDDARWLYEWSSPSPAPEDSETFPHSANPGTRVVVFD